MLLRSELMRDEDGGAPRTKPPHGDGLRLGRARGSVRTPSPSAGRLAQYRAFAGPAILIGVGYMDPGNWATDLQGGAQFRYGLLWVVLAASLMALVLQVISARLGVVTGRTLAELCHDDYPAWTRLPQWALAEVAVAACDLAEVLGSAVAINLLFHIPILWAVVITAADVLLLLGLQRLGVRWIEAIVLLLVATIGVCFAIELFVLPHTRPDFAEIGSSLLRPGLRSGAMTTIAIGIIGATVMPHNLYLHSALVQSRELRSDAASQRAAVRWNAIDSTVSLGLAFLVNAAILLLAAQTFHGRSTATAGGVRYALGAQTDWIRVAFLTLTPLMGAGAASLLFAIALLASGQSSTITGTLAGQVVMEGFLRLRMSPALRRLITRLVAIVPAIAIIAARGGGGINGLLVLSQVGLAMQLPFAMFPLLHLSGRRKVTGGRRGGALLLGAGWACALLITAVDVYGLPGALADAWTVIKP